MPPTQGRDPGTGLAVQPDKLTADLQRQFAGRRDHQGKRRAGGRQRMRLVQQLSGHGEPEGDGLAGAGLRRDDQVSGGLGLEHLGLDGGGLGIAAGGQSLGKQRRECGERHRIPNGTETVRGKRNVVLRPIGHMLQERKGRPRLGPPFLVTG
jgi:hypothetical protein